MSVFIACILIHDRVCYSTHYTCSIKFNILGFAFVFHLLHNLLPDVDVKHAEIRTSSLSHKMQVLKGEAKHFNVPGQLVSCNSHLSNKT